MYVMMDKRVVEPFSVNALLVCKNFVNSDATLIKIYGNSQFLVCTIEKCVLVIVQQVQKLVGVFFSKTKVVN